MDSSAAELNAQGWEGYRLSLQQERLWNLRHEPGLRWAMARAELTGPLDRAALGEALGEIFAGHEILRTSFKPVLGKGGAALMLVAESGAPTVEVDLSGRCAEAQERSIADYIGEMRDRPLHTPDPQPVRVALFAHHPEHHTLVVTAPRLCLDDRSAVLLFSGIAEAYAARKAGAPRQPRSIVQYADFAQWQLDSEEAAASATVRTAVAPLRLPMELTPRDETPAALRWTAPAETMSAISALARQHGTSSGTVLLACWAAALWRVGGQPERLSVETALACRPFAELAGALGSFESYAPMTIEVPEGPDLAGMVRAASAAWTALAALEDRLPARTSPEQSDPNRVGFSFVERPEQIAAAQIVLTALEIEAPSEPFKLELRCMAAGSRLDLSIRYNAAAFAPGGVDALACALRAMLFAAATSSPERLDAIPLLDPETAAALVSQSNPPSVPLTRPHCWHQAFTEQARRSPDATALECSGRRWSYGELDAFTNRMARVLRRRGVTRGSLVGLMLERSDLAIAALLAILKAGGAYVPLDPSLPARRRATIIAESRPVLLICDATGPQPAPDGVPALRLDLIRDEIEAEADAPLDGAGSGGDLAYVLFTSGTTGVPKGVAIEHAQLMHYVDGAVERLALGEPVRYVALGSLATDLGNTAIFPALCTGGSLDVVPVAVSADAQALAAHLASRPYDVLKITPSHLAALFAVADAPAGLLPRRSLVLGGEALSWGMLRLFRSFAEGCRIFNHYGPTETCVGVLAGEVTSDALADLASTVPLGRPLKHARAYIVDGQGQPVPRGVAGELWIGGETVARGYLTSGTERSERFLPDPWGNRPGARLYRSGDLVRQLPDGTIEFLGRLDRQVKIRGFRVELAEIEAVLRGHAEVVASLVVEAGESGSAHLVAYVVTKAGETGNAEWLRPYLQDRLPEFMIPVQCVALSRFPLNAAGKIDTAMLPDPATIRAAADSFTEPRTATEIAVAAIFSDLLFLEKVGVDADFFEIGGHSLLATRLLSRLRGAFPVQLSLRAVFENPTVEGLSAAIEARMNQRVEA
ncbi:MAG TPA: amino acid adenylation domain-containing protein [Beijerinckiaceae bacterium]